MNDEERWAELPRNMSDSDSGSDTAEVAGEDHIGNIEIDGPVYTYILQDSTNAVTVEHSSEKGLSFQLWPSALTLSHFAESQNKLRPGCWKGKRVVELGCGTGLVGLVFAALGANVLLTDKKKPLVMVQQNIELNAAVIDGAGGSAVCGELVWGKTEIASLGKAWQLPDLVVAADVVYMRELFQPLIASLSALGQNTPQCSILLAHVRRWKNDRHFFAKLRKTFDVIDISCQVPELAVEDATKRSSHTRAALRLFQITARPKGGVITEGKMFCIEDEN